MKKLKEEWRRQLVRCKDELKRSTVARDAARECMRNCDALRMRHPTDPRYQQWVDCYERSEADYKEHSLNTKRWQEMIRSLKVNLGLIRR